MAIKINKAMKDLAMMHDLLKLMYTEDYDAVHGDMEIIRHYVHDNYINIYFKFSNRFFNLVLEKDTFFIWTKHPKTDTIIKTEYTYPELLDLKYLK